MSKKLTGFIIVAGHLDIEWYQPMASYRFWTVEAFEDLRDYAAVREDFVCYMLDGQFFPLEMYLQAVPSDETSMRKLINEKKLVLGPFYTQFDEWLPSAESIIRNCLYGKRYCMEFGSYMRAGYLPDNFGHPMQLPQILQNFGIDSLMFMRGLPEIPGGHPDEFIYQGLDGSEVLVSHFRESYSGAFDIFDKDIYPIQPREVPYYADYLGFEWHKELANHDDPQRIAKNLVKNVLQIRDRYPSGIVPLIAGFDHLPPQINIGDSVSVANSVQDEIEFVMGDAEEYVKLVRSRISNPAVYNMELIGSKYQYVLLGALSTRSYLKRQNFACEVLMERYAEPIDALASLYGYPHKPALTDEAWRFLMMNASHDSIHGSSVDEVHVEMEARNGTVRQIAAGIVHDALKYIGKQMNPWRPLESLSFACLKSDFAQPHEVWLPLGERDGVHVIDFDGNTLPTQVLTRDTEPLNGIGKPRNEPYPDGMFRKVLFLAHSQANAISRYAPVDGSCAYPQLLAGDNFIENEYVRVCVDGALINITDKRTGYTHYNLNLLEEDADAGDAWDFSPTWIPGEVVRSSGTEFTCCVKEQGSVRAVLEMVGELDVPYCLEGDRRSQKRAKIPVTFLITVYAGVPRVDVKLSFDNTAKDHRIRLRIPTGLKTGIVRSQGHFAILDRPIERQKEIEPWRQPPTQLLPCREWIAVDDEKHGLSIAFKGLYDYEAVTDPLTGHPDLYLTLLRGFERMGRINTIQRVGGASPASITPGAQCLGIQEIEWAYLPYTPDMSNKAPFLPVAQAFLYPPVTHMIRSERIGGFECIQAPFKWDAPNVLFSAFKRAMDGNGYILRLYENQGKITEVDISLFRFSKVLLSGMDEHHGNSLSIENNTVKVTFEPYKAVTLYLS